MARRNFQIPGFAHANPVPTACQVGNIVMTGGIHGSNPQTGVVAATLDEQCANIFLHFRAVMDAVGGSLDDIIKVTVWLADFDERAIFNRHWLTAFPDPESRPTRHIRSGAIDLKPGTLVVCDLTAVLGTNA